MDRPAGPALLLLCLLLGGASAAAPVANAGLQVVAITVLCESLWAATWHRSGDIDWSVRLLGCAAGVMALQVVPLPPSIWSLLPDRGDILRGFELAGIAPGWMPLSWTPDGTIAAFLALLPPMAMIVAIRRSPPESRGLSILLLVLAATGMTLLGVAQWVGGMDSGLYPYRITNPGQPVGLFANRNHLATLLLCALPFVAAMARAEDAFPTGRAAALGGIAAILFGGVVLLQSDAGLLLLPLVLAGCAAILMKGRRLALRRAWASASIGATIAGVALVAAAGWIGLRPEHAVGVTADQRRGVIVPTSLRAAMDHMPFGTGGGSFQTVYPAYDDPAAVSLEYVNHAHSDYAELLLEYGLAGAAIALAALAVLARLAISAWRTPGVAGDRARAGVVALGVIAAHSAVDYPLRTAAIAAVAGLAAGLAAAPVTVAPRHGGRGPRRRETERTNHAILIEDL